MVISDYMLLIGSVLGGVGLFLLAVSLITDGLKLAAGEALTDLFGKWTKTTGRGIASGIIITGLVQSSSAVTVATIGFVNAGILSMAHAIGVVYGTNVGTTLTAWLVAAVGFKVNISLFALPLIGIGMLLSLSGVKTRRAAVGITMAGFGLFFVGVDVLKTTFEGIAQTQSFSQYFTGSVFDLIVYMGLGFMMTLLTQSSSAAIAIVLTAMTGGLVGFHAAAAMVIGANVGTTSTALISVIGATPNAKRVAAAHILFNALTAVVALLLLPLLLKTVGMAGTLFGSENIEAFSLAMFHTVFNVLGILLLWPFTRKLTAYLSQCFVSREEIEGQPRYLDKSMTVTSELAFRALSNELTHIAEIARRMSKEAISTELTAGDRLTTDYGAMQRLVGEVDNFVGKMGSGTLPDMISDELPRVLRCSQYLSAVAELSSAIDSAQVKIHPLNDKDLMADLAKFRSDLVTLVSLSDVKDNKFSLNDCEAKLNHLEERYQVLRESLLVSGAHQRIKIRDMTFTSEQLTRMHRLSEQLVKAMRLQAHFFEMMASTGAERRADRRNQKEKKNMDGDHE